jgi:assimilatory nitrate reductase catalytic subunit
MVPIPYTPPAEEPGGDYPFRLTTGRVIYQYLSGNQTRRLGFLNSQAPEPWVEIHPRAAEPLGIKTDDRVRVTTPRGSMELKALVVATIRPDTLFIPFHYGHRQAVNQLTNPAVEPTVKSPSTRPAPRPSSGSTSPSEPWASRLGPTSRPRRRPRCSRIRWAKPKRRLKPKGNTSEHADQDAVR